MTTEEKNIKICEALGLTKFAPIRYATRAGKLLPLGQKGVRVMYCEGGTNGWQDWTDCPNHFTDLNACYEMEKCLGDMGHIWDRYCEYLGGSLYHCAHASATQRAEAFGLTLNLWKQGE